MRIAFDIPGTDEEIGAVFGWAPMVDSLAPVVDENGKTKAGVVQVPNNQTAAQWTMDRILDMVGQRMKDRRKALAVAVAEKAAKEAHNASRPTAVK